MNQFDQEHYLQDLKKLVESNNKWLLKRLTKIFQAYDRRVPIEETVRVLTDEETMISNKIKSPNSDTYIKSSINDPFCSPTDLNTSIIMYNIAVNLTTLIGSNNIYDITKQCNIDSQHMNMYLNCELMPTVQDLVSIANYFNITIDKLIGREMK